MDIVQTSSQERLVSPEVVLVDKYWAGSWLAVTWFEVGYQLRADSDWVCVLVVLGHPLEVLGDLY